jgi:hypothetical protein
LTKLVAPADAVIDRPSHQPIVRQEAARVAEDTARFCIVVQQPEYPPTNAIASLSGRRVAMAAVKWGRVRGTPDLDHALVASAMIASCDDA